MWVWVGESGWKVLLLVLFSAFVVISLISLFGGFLFRFFSFPFSFSVILYYEFNVVDIPLPCSLSVFSFSTYFLLYLPLDLFMSLDVCPFCLFVCFYSASSHSFTIPDAFWKAELSLAWAWAVFGWFIVYFSSFTFCLWLCLFNHLFLFDSLQCLSLIVLSEFNRLQIRSILSIITWHQSRRVSSSY